MFDILSHIPQIIAALFFNAVTLPAIWIVFKRAGLNPFLALFNMVPYAGLLIVMAILAHTPWKTVPPLRRKVASDE